MSAKKTSAKKSSRKTTKKASKPAQAATAHPHYCNLPPVPTRSFGPDVAPGRLEILLVTSNKWVNGTTLKYYFFNGENDGSPTTWKGSKPQQDSVRLGFRTWKDRGIGLEFEEVDQPTDAEIRIGFQRGDGSWSYLGRDIIDLGLGTNERTMNFGWNVANDLDTVLHEIGHTLGFPHEHQNPFSGIVWDEDAVYAALAAPPNSWDRNTTYHNILRKLNKRDVEGSPHDPDSIMHYPFEAGLIKEPANYRSGLSPAGGLSTQDVSYAKTFYPPLTKSDYKTIQPGKAQSMNIEPGGQRNFIFKPKRTRNYTIHTLGEMDTVMVLFEKVNGKEIQMAGDDDSGRDYNARIRRKLIKDREYIIRVRLFYRSKEGETVLIIV